MPDYTIWDDDPWFLRGRRVIASTDIPGTSQYEGDTD